MTVREVHPNGKTGGADRPSSDLTWYIVSELTAAGLVAVAWIMAADACDAIGALWQPGDRLAASRWEIPDQLFQATIRRHDAQGVAELHVYRARRPDTRV
jgi:hypothetical protein